MSTFKVGDFVQCAVESEQKDFQVPFNTVFKVVKVYNSGRDITITIDDGTKKSYYAHRFIPIDKNSYLCCPSVCRKIKQMEKRFKERHNALNVWF